LARTLHGAGAFANQSDSSSSSDEEEAEVAEEQEEEVDWTSNVLILRLFMPVRRTGHSFPLLLRTPLSTAASA
jgi:hypothetical protein